MEVHEKAATSWEKKGSSMKNSEIYCKTLRFSLMRILCTLIGIVCMLGVPVVALALTGSAGEDTQVVVVLVALVVGIVIFVLIARYASYLFRAGQIAMIAEGVANDALPEDVYAAGTQRVRERFGTASVYFLISGIISGITMQITNGLNALGVSPRDMISILQAIKAAGALQAEIEVI